MAPPLKALDSNIMISKMTTLGKPTIGTKMTTRLSGKTNATTSMLKKMNLKDLSKRKADQLSPPKGKNTKRSAFCDITNATTNTNSSVGNVIQKKMTTTVVKKATAKMSVLAQPKLPTISKIQSKPAVKSTVGNEENVDPLAITKPVNVVLKRVKDIEVKAKQVDIELKSKVDISVKRGLKVKETKDPVKGKEIEEIKEKIVVEEKTEISKTEITISRKSTSEESSLYASALESLSTTNDESILIITPIKKEKVKVRTPCPPSGVLDFDKENWEDPCQVSVYAMDVFKYLKSREKDFAVSDYMPKQGLITIYMRSLLVDWMVDIQEHFELNHETLYLGVKILDLYLQKKKATKETLQLIGATSLFIASKYDERFPPGIDEFLHICENIYTREELVQMEMNIFRVIDFNLGMPLSYRFLRRYARCCKTSMPILTLARFILELSLMEYPFVFESESKTAAACLYLALRMKNVGEWSPTLEYYSGYKLEDFHSIACQLNTMLHKRPKEQLRTIRTKYSHTIFFEVAKTPLLENSAV